MTVPVISDGAPFEGVLAVMDESTPEAGAGVYFVLTAVVIPEPAVVAAIVRDVVGDRSRPFHFSKEGPAAIERMVDVLAQQELRAASLWSSVPRRGQVTARQRLLKEQVSRLADGGIDHVSIEAGDNTSNLRDRSAILDAFRDEGGVPFRYDWRSKAEPLLWVADAVSGIVAAHLLGRSAEHFDRLSDSGLLEVHYR